MTGVDAIGSGEEGTGPSGSPRHQRRVRSTTTLGMAILKPLIQGGGSGGWQNARPFVEALGTCIEAGLMILDGGVKVLFANQIMISILDLQECGFEGMPARELVDLVRRMVPDPPPVVRDRELIPSDGGIVCEEFEILGSSRTVVRWLPNQLTGPPRRPSSSAATSPQRSTSRERTNVKQRLTG